MTDRITFQKNSKGFPMKNSTVLERFIDAERLAANWLADGNEQSELGNRDRAERYYDLSQYWFDRANLLRSLLNDLIEK